MHVSRSLILSNEETESLTKQKNYHFMLSKVRVADGRMYQDKISFSIIQFKCSNNKLTNSIYYFEFGLI